MHSASPVVFLRICMHGRRGRGGEGGGEGELWRCMHPPPLQQHSLYVHLCIHRTLVPALHPDAHSEILDHPLPHPHLIRLYISYVHLAHTHTKWRNTLQTRARPHSRTRTTSARGTHRTTSMRTHPSHSLLPSRIPSWTTFLQRA